VEERMVKKGTMNKILLGVVLLILISTSTVFAQPPLVDTRKITINAPSLVSATYYPPNGIKLKWIDNSNNETKFTVKLITKGVFGPGQPESTRTEYRDLPANISTYMLPYAPGVYTTISMNASAPTGASVWSNSLSVCTMTQQPTLLQVAKKSGDYYVEWRDDAFNEGMYVLVVASDTTVKVFGYNANPPIVSAATPTPNLPPMGVVNRTLKPSDLPAGSTNALYKFFISAVSRCIKTGITGNVQVMANSFLNNITIPPDSAPNFLTTNGYPPLPRNLYGSQVRVFR
jgi:hypothetical protein